MSSEDPTLRGRSIREHKVAAILRSARPVHIIKTALVILWGEMAAGSVAIPSFLAIIAVVAGSSLWAGFYGLNDLFDADLDIISRHKRFRPLARGLLSRAELERTVAAELLLGLLCSCILPAPATVFALLAVGNQVVYNVAPLRLKDRPLFDILSAGVVSQSCKLGLGIYSGISRHGPHLVIAVSFALLWKCGFYLLYRLASEPPRGTQVRGTPGLLGFTPSLFVAGILIGASISASACFLFLEHLDRLFISVAVLAELCCGFLAVYFVYHRPIKESVIGLWVFGAREPLSERGGLRL